MLGYIGIELVEAFVKDGKKVTLIDALERPIPKYFDSDFTNIVENSLKKKGVSMIFNESVK